MPVPTCGMSSAFADIHTTACFSYSTTCLLSHPTAFPPAFWAAVFCLFPFPPPWRSFGGSTWRYSPPLLIDGLARAEWVLLLAPQSQARGALAGCISIRPAVLEYTDCGRPWASRAPHRLSRIMQIGALPCTDRPGQRAGRHRPTAARETFGWGVINSHCVPAPVWFCPHPPPLRKAKVD